MFLIRWVRKFISLPLEWLGQVAGWTSTGMDMPLLAAAWRVSGDGRTGRAALMKVRELYGSGQALAQAEFWLQRCPRPEIAAIGGLFALEADQPDMARQMLATGQRIGSDEEGVLELLEWYLAMLSDDPAAAPDLAARMATRRDLAPMVKRMVLCWTLWDTVLARRFDEAAWQAQRLLSIDNVPEAHMALWAVSLESGDAGGAQAHLQAARMPGVWKLYYQVLGNAAAGYREAVRSFLEQLRAAQPNLAAHARARLAASGVSA